MSESSSEEMPVDTEDQESSSSGSDVSDEDFDLNNAEEVADHLVDWISVQPFSGDNNFTVAVFRGNNIMISKVGGLGLNGRAAQAIIAHIRRRGIHDNRRIYFARHFSGDGGTSNHAEMCILAAAGAANISYIRCTSPNCKFCKATLAAYNVNNANAQGPDGRSQIGWRHPFLKAAFGTAMNNNEAGQLKELKSINLAQQVPARLTYGQVGNSLPQQNNRFEIDFSDSSSSSSSSSNSDT